MRRLITFEDDGLYTPVVHDYAEEKYRLIRQYTEMFSTGMKNKWGCLVYIDLFAGAGRARIIETGQIVASSASIAMEVRDKFHKYIFVEMNRKCKEALNKRIQRDYYNLETEIIYGDVNKSAQKILDRIPPHSKEKTVLSFCLVDPFRTADLSFSTVKALAENRRMDFMVLIPANMDINRAQEHYIKPDNTIVGNFLGDPGWRSRWDTFKMKNNNLGVFVTEDYIRQMIKLHFLNPGLEHSECVRNPKNNSPLYYLVFFSRHKRGLEFWNKARKGASDQQFLFD
jgi:three-Cys-motif partner protein